ncbi:RNA polymerase sigma factor SigJ [Actinospica robiniae]|uniref:RNA polymerase sigma factor SigJ n=1 Tax=Actinospica robiniae TaxID=304901 RepID=UPI00040157E1|nr:RNA polymerase sigma factor SigJ [Actinospica robiniae]
MTDPAPSSATGSAPGSPAESTAGSAWYAEQFERQRPRLRAVAYRMLGSLADADDAVQEAWLRLGRADGSAIADLSGWLITVVGRVCVDMLRTDRARREDLHGSWLPEPVISAADSPDPEQEILLADSVGLALLVVLHSLRPAERLAFVLHDMFGVPFEEIAPIVEKTPAATRQLASRARRRVHGSETRPDADVPTQRRIAEAFLAAARGGDVTSLLELLDPDVRLRIDTGPGNWLTPPLVLGAREVAEHAAVQGPRFAHLWKPALVNGAAGMVAHGRGGFVAVAGLTVVHERICEIDLILDPEKLTGVKVEEIEDVKHVVSTENAEDAAG